MSINLEKEFFDILPKEYTEAVLASAKTAESMNINIFLIGGIVRDILLKREIKDIDISAECNIEEFGAELCKNSGCEIIAKQENLHTIKVKFPSGVVIDFASTREEKYPQAGKLPVAYNFGCKLEDDVKRRDFTINTLAISLTGKNKFHLIDFYNGFEDLCKKRIKILHKNSFIDDPSRIIRALKFKIRLNFDYEETTYNLMKIYTDNVNYNMPLERIKGELKEYFSIKHPQIYSHLIETEAYKLLSDNPIFPVNEERFKEIENFCLFEENEKWFIYFCLVIINSDFKIERYSLTSFEKRVLSETKQLLNKKICETASNEEIYFTYNNVTNFSILLYYVITGNKTVHKFLKALKEIKVLITGKDLINLGFIPSPKFNEIFEKIIKKKLNGELSSKDDEIKFVKSLL